MKIIKRFNENVICSGGDESAVTQKLFELYGFEMEDVADTDIVTFEGEEMLASRKAEILEARAEQTKQTRIAEIKVALAEIDLKSIRALREGSQEYIAQYEQQAQALRTELQELQV